MINKKHKLESVASNTQTERGKQIRKGLIESRDQFSCRSAKAYTEIVDSLKEESKTLKKHFKENIKAYLLLGLIIGFGIEVHAFDLDAAGKAISDPVKKFINDYWPVGVLAVGSGGAMIAQGDLRTKAIGFGTGSLIAGLMMVGVKLGLGIA